MTLERQVFLDLARALVIECGSGDKAVDWDIAVRDALIAAGNVLDIEARVDDGELSALQASLYWSPQRLADTLEAVLNLVAVSYGLRPVEFTDENAVDAVYRMALFRSLVSADQLVRSGEVEQGKAAIYSALAALVGIAGRRGVDLDRLVLLLRNRRVLQE